MFLSTREHDDAALQGRLALVCAAVFPYFSFDMDAVSAV
jgi:hypothetical protein